MRSRFGGQSEPVTAANVEEIRRSLDKGGFTPKAHQVDALPETAELPSIGCQDVLKCPLAAAGTMISGNLALQA